MLAGAEVWQRGAMPQTQLPVFPDGATDINDRLAFEKRDGRVVYFHGLFPVFTHAEDDLLTFRMITSQFCVQGSATQRQIVEAFGGAATHGKALLQALP